MSITSLGLEPANFQVVGKYLSHYATIIIPCPDQSLDIKSRRTGWCKSTEQVLNYR
jgi:hypothetical protein